ncbi:MAG: T9SS type A sorting domain-containing protein [Bacteroidetes bacterium]|nr:T9SS type A sorting domain-containing protein [Bacteroidota bacterium]
MKKLLYIFLFFSYSLFGQNLVPNPSFEQFDTCPNNIAQLNHAIPWFNPSDNQNISGSSDYFNSCYNNYPNFYNADVPSNFIGNQNAKTGVAYAGFYVYGSYFPNAKEYIEVKLNNSLQANKKYCIEFYVSLADSANFATDDVGVYFSIDTVKQDTIPFTVINNIPQIVNPIGNFLSDKINWTLISGEYTALGDEKFITIGSFKDDSLVNRVFVGGGDTSLYGGTYNSSYYYIDNVLITPCDSIGGISDFKIEDNIKVFPNPTSGLFNVQMSGLESVQMKIYNVYGECIYQQICTSAHQQIDLSEANSGIYFLQLKTDNGTAVKKIIKE